MKGKCKKEKQLAVNTKMFIETAIRNSKKQQIVIFGWDKYAGRISGLVIVDGVNLSELLIQRGYAISYHGEKKEHDWCR